MTPLDQSKIDKIKEVTKLHPTWGDRRVASLCEVDRDTVKKYRDRTVASTPVPEPVEDTRLMRENAALRKMLNDALERETKYKDLIGLTTEVYKLKPDPPTWLRKPHTVSSSDIAIATAFLSDLHLDEVVTASQVQGMNAYNRTIAEKRLKKFFDSALQLTFDHMKGIKIEGLVLPLGGDIFSGNIHEELKQTNEGTILESILHWSEFLVAGIRLLAEEFKQVHIPCVVGNHGRNTYKPIAKNRAQDNFDWLLYHLLARELKDLKHVTFDISAAADVQFTIYDTTFLLTHGDQFKGGSGIAGLLSPLMIGAHRKVKRQQAFHNPFDYMILGHWHQYAMFKNIIVNGSLKGYDEYAFISNFDLEPPRQAYWLTQPKYGITISGPLHVTAKDEKWT